MEKPVCIPTFSKYIKIVIKKTMNQAFLFFSYKIASIIITSIIVSEFDRFVIIMGKGQLAPK